MDGVWPNQCVFRYFGKWFFETTHFDFYFFLFIKF